MSRSHPPATPVWWALLVPFAYVYRTRIRPDRAILGLMLFSEWIPAFLILTVLHGTAIPTAIHHFGLAYVAFIAVYEIGYLANDLRAGREKDGRRRLGGSPPGPAWVTAGVVARLAVFAAVTLWLGRAESPRWWAFYGALALAFSAHNVLSPGVLRIGTFVLLATARFFAPVFAFVGQETLKLVLPSVLLLYVLHRTLAYADSKSILELPGRERTGFKVGFYAVLLLPSGLLSLLAASWAPLALNGYYLGLWGGGWATGVGTDRGSDG